jgi:hypothetical protein
MRTHSFRSESKLHSNVISTFFLSSILALVNQTGARFFGRPDLPRNLLSSTALENGMIGLLSDDVDLPRWADSTWAVIKFIRKI